MINNVQCTTENKEKFILKYFEDYESELDEMLKFESLKENCKEKFVQVIDFIFYNTSINGITYDGVNENKKNKLKEILINIDSKIENKIPNYKKNIAEKTQVPYLMIMDKISEGKEIIIDEISKEKYNSLKEKKKEARNLLNNTKEKIKSIYEGWR